MLKEKYHIFTCRLTDDLNHCCMLTLPNLETCNPASVKEYTCDDIMNSDLMAVTSYVVTILVLTSSSRVVYYYSQEKNTGTLQPLFLSVSSLFSSAQLMLLSTANFYYKVLLNNSSSFY